VEDNKADVFLIRAALAATHLNPEIHVVNDGEEATRFFDDLDQDSSSACPALVILDINLPKKQGADVLTHIRNSFRCPNALILVATTSDSPQDRQEMRQLGANGYFRKPSEYDAFLKLGDLVKELLAPESGRAGV
jgi:chemotaxis family two-component system response regulator Rcp1